MRKYAKEWRKEHRGYSPNTDASIRKTCTKCHEENPATAEYFAKEKTRPLGVGSHCNKCRSKKSIAYNKLHVSKELSKKRSKEFHEKRPDYERSRSLLRRNMTVAEHDAIFNAQGGVCAICMAPPTGAGKLRLAVDHDHVTGKNRGLLCILCNHALERMETIPEWHEMAISYLMKFALAKMEKELK